MSPRLPGLVLEVLAKHRYADILECSQGLRRLVPHPDVVRAVPDHPMGSYYLLRLILHLSQNVATS